MVFESGPQVDDDIDDENFAADSVGQPLRFRVPEAARLDVAVTEAARAQGLVLSRTRAKSLIEDGHLLVDGAPVRDASQKLKVAQDVTLSVPAAIDPEPKGEAIPLTVVFEDEHLIVLDKPAGMVVHPAPGHSSGTLVNALIAHCGASLSGIGGVKRPGIVHRIDKDTSGLLAVAKTDVAHRGFSTLFADHGRTLPLLRRYTALVWGRPSRMFGTIEAPIGRHPTDRQRMAVVSVERGREAITHWRLEDSFGASGDPAAISLVSCTLETGRTHQIRVHLAHSGHPLLGDPVYGKGFLSKVKRLPPDAQAHVSTLGRQALHATTLGFAHPITGEMLEFESSLPDDLTRLIAVLRTRL